MLVGCLRKFLFHFWTVCDFAVVWAWSTWSILEPKPDLVKHFRSSTRNSEKKQLITTEDSKQWTVLIILLFKEESKLLNLYLMWVVNFYCSRRYGLSIPLVFNAARCIMLIDRSRCATTQHMHQFTYTSLVKDATFVKIWSCCRKFSLICVWMQLQIVHFLSKLWKHVSLLVGSTIYWSNMKDRSRAAWTSDSWILFKKLFKRFGAEKNARPCKVVSEAKTQQLMI